MIKALFVMHTLIVGEEGALLAFDIVGLFLSVIYMLVRSVFPSEGESGLRV